MRAGERKPKPIWRHNMNSKAIRPMTKISKGDWILYKHASGLFILGSVKKVGTKLLVASDWLSDDVISRESIVEVRKKAVKP